MLSLMLDPGEASAIALAMELNDSLLIIDERKGRNVAKKMKVDIIGTLKILLLAKNQGIVSSVKQVIEALEEKSFRFSKLLVKEVLYLAGEINDQ